MQKIIRWFQGEAPRFVRAIVTDEAGYPVIITVKLEGGADE